MKQENFKEVQVVNEKLQTVDSAVWKPVSGFEGLYEVSNCGKVRSLKRECIKEGKRINSHPGKILTQNNGSKGYKLVALCKGGVCKTFKVHRLVAKMFIENPLNLPQVNHKDLNKSNNSLDNLEWCTNLENMQHAFTNGVHNYRQKK